MTFQSLFQANLNGLKQQLYSSILAVCVSILCGHHESCVTIVDFGLCSAVWRHWTQKKTLLKLFPPFFEQNSIRQVSSTLAHRNYVFFVLANGSLKLPFIPAQKSLTVEGVLCTSLPVYGKNRSYSSKAILIRVFQVTQPYFNCLVLRNTVCGRYW